MRPGSRTKVSVPLVLPQNRHPERSASKIYRLTQDLKRGVEEPVLSVVEGTPAMLIGRCSSQLSGNRKLKKSQPPSVAEDAQKGRIEGCVIPLKPKDGLNGAPSLRW